MEVNDSMFTGIIEEIGTVREVVKQGSTMQLTIEAKTVLEDVNVGDSISVNGVCLTVTEFDRSTFKADVMPETFRKTNLHLHAPGMRVNLERAMALGKRFGGHIVQGHVDGTGVITGIRPEENAVVYTVRPERQDLFVYMIPQGSVALDGISLTLVQVGGGHFSVSIIPHTLRNTVLSERKVGDIVNIECDVLGKYVHNLLKYRDEIGPSAEKGLSISFLSEHGFA